MRCNGSNWAVYSPGSWDGFRNDVWALWAGVIMRLEHHLVGGYVRYISPHIIIIIIRKPLKKFPLTLIFNGCWHHDLTNLSPTRLNYLQDIPTPGWSLGTITTTAMAQTWTMKRRHFTTGWHLNSNTTLKPCSTWVTCTSKDSEWRR